MRLLIVGTLKGQLTTATKLAMDKGATVTHADLVDQALAVLRSGRGADLIMADVALDIRDLVVRLEAEHIHVPIVACGTSNDARAAVAAIHAGAKEYIPLPPDPELIAAVLAAVTNDSRELIYRDEIMGHVVKLAQQIAPSDASVLITGEIGHRQGGARPLRARPLQPRARPLRPGQLRGDSGASARIRAVRPREGRLHRSRRPPHRQVRGGERRHTAAGRNLRDGHPPAGEAPARHPGAGDRPRRRHEAGPVDIRIIATSNRNLAEAVREGVFREDLLFRLNVVNLKIPPLRERPADVIELAQHFIKKYSAANGLTVRQLSAEARRTLVLNRWPGNVRELENTIHRAVLLTTGEEIGTDAILTPDGMRLDQVKGLSTVAHATMAAEAVTRALVGRTVADVERDLILETLKHCLGNRTHAANILGISIRTLRNKLNEYSGDGAAIPPPGGGEAQGRRVRADAAIRSGPGVV